MKIFAVESSACLWEFPCEGLASWKFRCLMVRFCGVIWAKIAEWPNRCLNIWVSKAIYP